MSNKPKILYWDIETAPNVTTSWGLWVNGQLNHNCIIKERYIICGSWKYNNDRKVYSTVVDFKDPSNDRGVVEDLRQALSSCDAVVHHNGDSFDLKWVNTRLVYYGLKPIPELIQIDTKKLAKKKFRFNCNKLDYIGQYLGLGKKIKTDYDLWKGCMAGDTNALYRMVKYNKRDVRLLEKVYKKLAPYIPTRLNYRLFSEREGCKNCGSSKIQYRGYHLTTQKKYKRYQCNNCGQWGHSK